MQHDFILLDRSGSMTSLWDEALSSINSYVAKLAIDNVDTGVTLAVFDGSGFDVIRDRIIPTTWREVSSADATPRGTTPLSDAVGKIVDLADRGNYDKVAILIMTDGHENSSRELSVADAKKLLDRCRAKNWQVIFLGADFDNAQQAAGYGNASASTAQVAKGNLRASSENVAGKRATYGVSGQSIIFSDEEKAAFAAKSGTAGNS